ncbi:MAG: hypothetical protein Q9183_000500 [Haloplaca sp. 2 TL-2023]
MLKVTRLAVYADYTFLLAAAWAIAYQGMVIGLLSKGLFGTHVWDLTIGKLDNTAFLLVLITESIYGPFIWMIKFSMLLMYLHIFGRTNPRFQYMVWGGAAVMGLFYFASLIGNLVLCAPRSHETYIKAFSAQRCARSKDLSVATGVFNVLSDLYLLLLPVREVLVMNNTLKKRLKVLGVFMTGIVALVASACGLYFRVIVNTRLDNTWNIMPVYLTITIEMTCGIFVLCAPALRGVFRLVAPSIRKYLAGSSGPVSGEGQAHRRKAPGSRGVGGPRNNGQRGQRASDDSGMELQNLRSAPAPQS